MCNSVPQQNIMYLSSYQYGKVATKQDLFWSKISYGIFGGLWVVLSMIGMAFGTGLPWWAGLLASLPLVTLLNWLVWKKNAHILHLGEKPLEEDLRDLPNE